MIIRTLKSAVNEWRLLAEGRPYVTRSGAIRINANPEPSVSEAAKDVYVRVASHPVVAETMEVGQKVFSNNPGDVEDVAVTAVANIAPKLIDRVKQVFRGG